MSRNPVTHLSPIKALKTRMASGPPPTLSVTRQIVGATATVAVTTAVVAVVTVPRELLVAARFGTGAAADALLMALVVPTFVLGVLGGSVTSAFIPTYLRIVEQHGHEAGNRLLGEITTWLLGMLCLISIVVGLVSPLILRIIASGFTGSKLAMTQQGLLVLLLTVPLGGIGALWSATLNANGAFALPSISQGIIPIAGIFALLAFADKGIEALIVGMVIGFALRALILALALQSKGVATVPIWPRPSEDVRRVGLQYAPLAAASVLMGGTTLVDQAVAASLGPGSVATLGYGLKFITLATSLGSFALGTAVLPFFSRMVATSNWSELRSTVRTFSLLALLATVPIGVIASLFAVPLVSLLYERGAFSATDTVAVAQVLAFGVWQLPFLAVGIVYVRLVSSLGANQLLLVQTAIVLGLNVVFDVVLSRYAGVAGIALATTLMYAAALVILVIAARVAMRRAAENATDPLSRVV